MMKKGSVHVDDITHPTVGFRVEGDPHNPEELVKVEIQPHDDQSFDLIITRNDLKATYKPDTNRYEFELPQREIYFGITGAELEGILGEVGRLEFADFDTSEVSNQLPDISMPGATAAETRAFTTQGNPPPAGHTETERANARAPGAPLLPAAGDQKDRSHATRENQSRYDPVTERLLRAEEARTNFWSSSKTPDVLKALTSDGIPLKHQDPRIQEYWNWFNDPERQVARLKAMSGVSAIAGMSVGLAAAAPALASGAGTALSNIRLAASMGSTGAAAFSLIASYPRLSMFALDIMAGMAEMPSVTGTVARGSHRLAPTTVKMAKSAFGSSSKKGLFNTAANTASDVVAAIANSNCFPADTLVSTVCGTKPIQDIRVGDEVLSYDEIRSKRVLNRVVRTFCTMADELITIMIDDDEIEATPGHPFWVDHRGWTRAEALNAGDALRTSDGRPRVVDGVSRNIKPGNVFNFEVHGAHTYYASRNAVLVHNASASNAAIKVRKILGKPATDVSYTGSAEGLVVPYNLYRKLRRYANYWDDIQGHHLVEDHLFAYAKSEMMRPLGKYVPTLVMTTNEHLSTVHTTLNYVLKSEGLYGRSLSRKELLRAIDISYDFYVKNGLGHIAASIKQFKNEVFMPIYNKKPNG